MANITLFHNWRLRKLKPFLINLDTLDITYRNLGAAEFRDVIINLQEHPTNDRMIYCAGLDDELYWVRLDGGVVVKYDDPDIGCTRYLNKVRELIRHAVYSNPDSAVVLYDLLHTDLHALSLVAIPHIVQQNAENTVSLINDGVKRINDRIGALTPELSAITLLNNQPYYGALHSNGSCVVETSVNECADILVNSVTENLSRQLRLRSPAIKTP